MEPNRGTQIHELETVVLTRDVAEYRLRAGDIGAVVHRYSDGTAFEVEFVTADGRTVAVLTLEGGDIRKLQSSEILHARETAHT